MQSDTIRLRVFSLALMLSPNSNLIQLYFALSVSFDERYNWTY